jgi:hypothetical protein
MNATNLNEWKTRLANPQQCEVAVREIVERLAATSLERLEDLDEFDRIGQLIAAARLAYPEATRVR